MQFCLEYSVSGSTLPPPARISAAAIVGQLVSTLVGLFRRLCDLSVLYSQALSNDCCGKYVSTLFRSSGWLLNRPTPPPNVTALHKYEYSVPVRGGMSNCVRERRFVVVKSSIMKP